MNNCGEDDKGHQALRETTQCPVCALAVTPLELSCMCCKVWAHPICIYPSWDLTLTKNVSLLWKCDSCMLGTPVPLEVSGRMSKIEDILKFLVTEVTEIKSNVNLPWTSTRAQQGVPPIEDSPAVKKNENSHTSSLHPFCYLDILRRKLTSVEKPQQYCFLGQFKPQQEAQTWNCWRTVIEIQAGSYNCNRRKLKQSRFQRDPPESKKCS